MTTEAYLVGFSSANHFKPPYPENPYPYPAELDRKRMAVAGGPAKLTEDEKVDLSKLNDEFDRTDWAQWSFGNYDRWVRPAREKDDGGDT